MIEIKCDSISQHNTILDMILAPQFACLFDFKCNGQRDCRECILTRIKWSINNEKIR